VRALEGGGNGGAAFSQSKNSKCWHIIVF